MPELRPGDLLPRVPSFTQVMQEWVDSEGVTRYKLVSLQTKLNEDTKRIFIEEYAKHGRIGTAARMAGVKMSTFKKLITKDPEFGLAMAEALECYKDRLIDHHQNLVFNGTVKTTYGRDGSIVSEETIYPIRLIELELKKHDEGYRDRKDVSVNITGGVLVAPAKVSMEDWEAKFSAPKLVGDIVEAVIADIAEGEDTNSPTPEDHQED